MKNKNKKKNKKNGNNKEKTIKFKNKGNKLKGISRCAFDAIEISQNLGSSIGRQESIDKLDVDIWSRWTVLNCSRWEPAFIIQHIRETVRFIFDPVNPKMDSTNLSFYVYMSSRLIGEAREDLSTLLDPDSHKRIMTNIVALGSSSEQVGCPDFNDSLVAQIICQALQNRAQINHESSSINEADRRLDLIQLDLSGLHCDVGLLKSGILFDVGQRPCVEFLLKAVDLAGVQTVAAINLAQNRLKSVSAVRQILDRFASSLVALDFTNNNISHLEARQFPESLLNRIQRTSFEGNPFQLKMIRQKSRNYVRSFLLDIFPKLTHLNEEKLDHEEVQLSRIKSGTSLGNLPQPQIAFFYVPSMQNDLLTFVRNFFTAMDSKESGGRHSLLDFYHPDLSQLTFHSASHQLMPSNLDAASREGLRVSSTLLQHHNRNLLRCQDPQRRLNFVKRGNLQIVGFLDSLPVTRHFLKDDLGSFRLDVPFCNPQMIVLNCQGAFFQQSSTEASPALRQFQRTLIITNPNKIINDSWMVCAPTSSYFTLLSTSNLIVPQNIIDVQSESKNEDLVEKLVTKTGMNSVFSRKCLQELNWDLEKALETFASLSQLDKLPKEAFL